MGENRIHKGGRQENLGPPDEEQYHSGTYNATKVEKGQESMISILKIRPNSKV